MSGLVPRGRHCTALINSGESEVLTGISQGYGPASTPAALATSCSSQGREPHVVEAMRELRERLWKDVLSMESGDPVRRETVDKLSHLMAEHPMLTRLKATGSASTTELWFDPRQPEELFAPLAYSAAMLFADVDRDRVRKCGQCVLHFYDVSKKGTRRLCSMKSCGNRLKVAAYAARQRSW